MLSEMTIQLGTHGREDKLQLILAIAVVKIKTY